MKIEYAVLIVKRSEMLYGSQQVVRLPEVDKVIQEAVWAMETVQNSVRNYWSDALVTDESAVCVDEAVAKDARYQHAEAFLASPVVKAWRERQEGKK